MLRRRYIAKPDTYSLSFRCLRMDDSAEDAYLYAPVRSAVFTLVTVSAGKQDGDITLNLAAAAQRLEAMATEQPEEEEVAATPPPTAEVAPGDMGTPWTKEVTNLPLYALRVPKLLSVQFRLTSCLKQQGSVVGLASIIYTERRYENLKRLVPEVESMLRANSCSAADRARGECLCKAPGSCEQEPDASEPPRHTPEGPPPQQVCNAQATQS